MAGPRIVALIYWLDMPDGVTFRAESIRDVHLDGFVSDFSHEYKFKAIEPFNSAKEARDHLEPQLDSWRQWTTLMGNGDLLAFRYQRAEREPWPADSDEIRAEIEVATTLSICGSTPYLERTVDFPELPPPFRVDGGVELGVELLSGIALSPRHALHSAFSYLTFLEVEHGNRRGVARALNIHMDVLNDIGRLTSEGGERSEARKFEIRVRDRIELSDARRQWLERALRELVKRQGQFAAGAVPAEVFATRMP
jgi:hypothetical protein